MITFPGFCDFAGSVFIFLSFLSFFYAFLKTYISDQTLYDRCFLPSTDPNKLTYFIEPSINNENMRYGTVFDKPEVYVSFVVPAYNEESRIIKMLEETLQYLRTRRSNNDRFTYEVLIVDDGSKDSTASIVLDYASKYSEIRLLRQPYNMGKGAAILAGCSHCRGELILIVDADGATKIDEFGELEKKINSLKEINKESIVVGSRAHLDGKNKANRAVIRKFLGLSFHLLTVASGVRGIKDTQCGFKLFTREAARWLFPNQHIERWCFDPELIVIGQRRGMCIAELPVEWYEIEGSKIRVSSMIKMFIDLVRIAVFYRLDIWKIKDKSLLVEEEFI